MYTCKHTSIAYTHSGFHAHIHQTFIQTHIQNHLYCTHTRQLFAHTHTHTHTHTSNVHPHATIYTNTRVSHYTFTGLTSDVFIRIHTHTHTHTQTHRHARTHSQMSAIKPFATASLNAKLFHHRAVEPPTWPISSGTFHLHPETRRNLTVVSPQPLVTLDQPIPHRVGDYSTHNCIFSVGAGDR